MNQMERGGLGEETYERIKAAIRDGTFPPGSRLTEADLVERFRVSRTPVRQALARLDTEGLLSHEPRHGIVVTRPDHQQVVELYAMREVLESTAARFAAQHANTSEIRSFEQMLEEEEAISSASALSALNVRIHTLLHRAAHNRYLLRGLAQLTDTMALLQTTLGDPARARESHREHLEIFEAIRRRDGDAAAAAMLAHIRSAQNHRIHQLLRHGE